MMDKTIIGFGSVARIGKDYAYGIIKEAYPEAQRVAFADALKDDLALIFRNNNLAFHELVSDEEEKKKIRPLMVEYGQLMRSWNPQIWLDRAFEKLTDGLTIITDVRFPNEVARLKAEGGTYVHINGPVPPINSTEAENLPLMEKLADFTIYNDFSPSYDKVVKGLVQIILRQKSGKVFDFVD